MLLGWEHTGGPLAWEVERRGLRDGLVWGWERVVGAGMVSQHGFTIAVCGAHVWKVGCPYS